jgi:hypothetical protein
MEHIIISGCKNFLPKLGELDSLDENYRLYLCDQEISAEDILFFKHHGNIFLYPIPGEVFIMKAVKDSDGTFILSTEFQDSNVLDEEDENKITIVDYTAKKRSVDFDQTFLGVMERFNTCRFLNRRYLTPVRQLTITEIIEDITENYNLFSGKQLPDDMDETTIQAINNIMDDYCYTLFVYLSLGFDREQIVDVGFDIPYWTMNLYGRSNHLLIKYFDLIPAGDKSKYLTLEFGENPQYRKIITEAMIAVYISFSKANGIISPGSSSYKKPDFYRSIIEGIKI